MWLFRHPDASWSLAILLGVLLVTQCVASPAYHEILPQRSNRAISPSLSDIDVPRTLSLTKRVEPVIPDPVRVIEYLQERINTNVEQPFPGSSPNDPEGIWTVCLEHVSHFLINPSNTLDPIDNAAAKLGRLYDLAMATLEAIIEAHGYPSEDDDNVLSLRLGQVEIDWTCREGALCWHMLYDFCLLMKEKVARGYVGMYQGQLTNVATGVVTWVNLKIRRGTERGMALPRRGTGGGLMEREIEAG